MKEEYKRDIKQLLQQLSDFITNDVDFLVDETDFLETKFAHDLVHTKHALELLHRKSEELRLKKKLLIIKDMKLNKKLKKSNKHKIRVK